MVGVNMFLILLTLWLSSYQFSPLGFSTGRIPVVRGFLLTTFFRSNIKVASGGTITLPGGSDASIHLDTLPVSIHCLWSSAAGAALDDPQSCDTVYSPPNGIARDVLKVNIQADCGLPEVQGQIKVNILP